MKAIKNRHYLICGHLILWVAVLSLALPVVLGAAYKVVLKDGKILEARSKPISMEGHFRFTDTQNRFHAVPLHLIDLSATQALNSAEGDRPKSPKVLTNDDISSKSAVVSEDAGHRPAPLPSKPSGVTQGKSTPNQKKDEAYWRGRAKQIRDEIARVDSEIKTLDEKTKSGKSDGIKIGLETYNSVIYANFESQAKELEKQKTKLHQMMAALEEEARKAGALPAWLR